MLRKAIMRKCAFADGSNWRWLPFYSALRIIHFRPQNCALNYRCTSRLIFHFLENSFDERTNIGCRGFIVIVVVVYVAHEITCDYRWVRVRASSTHQRTMCVRCCCQVHNEFLMLLLDIRCSFVQQKQRQSAICHPCVMEKKLLAWKIIFRQNQIK